MYGCPGCGGQMTFDIPSQQLKCGRCGRTATVEEADRMEERHSESSFSMDLLTCPNCGAEIRALNAAAASFCSYCGSSVMLDRQDSTLDAPEGIIPFQVTREQCFEKYQTVLKKSLCADHRLRKTVTAESFRGIYVPFHVYAASVQGSATLKGQQTRGDTTYYYDTKVYLDHRYDGILHDASEEFPDSMSRRISEVPAGKLRSFSPAYLSGYYADASDTNPDAYVDYARTEAVRKGLEDVLSDMKDGCTYSTLPAQKELMKVARAEYRGVAMIPVWFMSMRSGKRVLYAVQNGVTGEMTADIPMDYPRFSLFALLLAIPLFFVLNTFLTLRPEMVLCAAMALAVAAQFIVNARLTRIVRRNADAEHGTETFDAVARLKEVNQLARRLGKGRDLAAFFSRFSGVGLAIPVLAVAAVMMSALSQVDDVGLFKLIAAALTAAMIGAVAYGGSKKTRLPMGSLAALLTMIAGTVILVLDPFRSEDLPVYLVALLCMAAVIWESLDLILLYNKECSSPLPQFETHQGGEDRA